MQRLTQDDVFKAQLLNICKEEASPKDIVAASIHSLPLGGEGNEKEVFNVLLILDSPKLILRHSFKRLRTLKGLALSILVVNQKTFERDVENDWLGGLIVENMLVPYEPLINREYLWNYEVKAKKRIIVEILNNIVTEYPEMSNEMLIKPEYFMFEAMARKASLHPPIAYRFLNIFREGIAENVQESMMQGFRAALDEVAMDGLVEFSDGYVRITRKFIDTIQRRRLNVLNFFKMVRNILLRHSLEVFPKMMRSLIEDYTLIAKHIVRLDRFGEIEIPELQDTKRFLFIPTSSGLASLSEKVTIEEFARRNIPQGSDFKFSIEKLGGALNTVYLLRLRRGDEEKKLAVKIFKDWYGWKWFPLALWAFGTRGFAVLGKRRLEKEYSINRFLASHSVNVPRIVYVSTKERLIFQEHIEGEPLAKMIKEEKQTLGEIMRKVGGEIAKVHGLGVALGDCKPENIIISPEGKTFFVDLEQAERDGNQAWDIAELLFYTGHYLPLSPINFIQRITREFIEGYLRGGGKAENISRAVSPRYIKVFSFFTSPHIIFAISKICREMSKLKKG